MQNHEKVQRAVQTIRAAIGPAFTARIGVVLGTGAGGDAASDGAPNEPPFQEAFRLPYRAIPGFPTPTTESHAGALRGGFLAGVPVFLLEGRVHLYEGYTPEEVCLGVRVLCDLGAETLILTNAAGALNPLFEPGQLMCLCDQINFTGASPLTGPNHDAWGLRFPDMSQAFDPVLQQLAAEEALRLSIPLQRGVYLGLRGPQMETPAETRALRILGADAVGMSTTLEVIAARHRGVKVLGISCLTNKNLPDCMGQTTLEAVIEAARQARSALMRLIAAVAGRIDAGRP